MTAVKHAPIKVILTTEQIADLIYKALEDNEDDVDRIHARYAIDYTIRRLDELGLIARDAEVVDR
jgi:hypothetical protein